MTDEKRIAILHSEDKCHPAMKSIFDYIKRQKEQGSKSPEEICELIKIANKLNTILEHTTKCVIKEALWRFWENMERRSE